MSQTSAGGSIVRRIPGASVFARLVGPAVLFSLVLVIYGVVGMLR